MAGGPQPGAGRPQSGATGARKWFRSIVDDPERRALFLSAIDRQLEAGDTSGYLKAVEHGYGRAPQSLTISGGRAPVAVFAIPGAANAPDLPAGATRLPVADADVNGEG